MNCAVRFPPVVLNVFVKYSNSREKSTVMNNWNKISAPSRCACGRDFLRQRRTEFEEVCLSIRLQKFGEIERRFHLRESRSDRNYHPMPRRILRQAEPLVEACPHLQKLFDPRCNMAPYLGHPSPLLTKKIDLQTHKRTKSRIASGFW